MEQQRERVKALAEARRGQEERGVLAQSPAEQGLPSHATVAIRVIMEFVHDDAVDLGAFAFAQREIPRSLETAESANWILTALALAALVLRVLPRLKKRDNPRSTV